MTGRWRGTAGRRPVRRILPPAALVLAAVLYASWLLGPVLNPAMDTVGGYASELAARDQPYGLLFRLGDLATGLTVAVVGAPLAAGATGWPRVGWFGAAGFGVATALDGLFTPMDCAPSIDPWCARLEDSGQLSTTHQLHTFTSSAAVAAAFVSLVGLLVAVSRRAVRRVGVVLSAFLLVTTVGTLVEVTVGGGWLGLWQRAQLLGLSGWLLLAAALAGRATGRGAGSVAGRAAGSAAGFAAGATERQDGDEAR
ncbi:MAG TPA: DUF998 domain-containing protein [Micromonospora sp.]